MNEASGIFGTGQLFLEGVKTEAVMDALIENTAERGVAFQNQNIGNACFFGGNCRRESRRTAADDNDIILFHFRHLTHILWDSISEPPLFLQIFSMGMPVSRERISIVLDVQKPAWQRPMP